MSDQITLQATFVVSSWLSHTNIISAVSASVISAYECGVVDQERDRERERDMKHDMLQRLPCM